MVRMKTADIVSGIILVALGVAMMVGGYTMDRLEIRSIHPASIPGLVPMILGVLIFICGFLLTFTSFKGENTQEIHIHDVNMLFYALALCLGFSLILLGWIPFTVATFIFISLATFRFGLDGPLSSKEMVAAIVKAAIFGAVMSAGISALFRYAFLVRLP